MRTYFSPSFQSFYTWRTSFTFTPDKGGRGERKDEDGERGRKDEDGERERKSWRVESCVFFTLSCFISQTYQLVQVFIFRSPLSQNIHVHWTIHSLKYVREYIYEYMLCSQNVSLKMHPSFLLPFSHRMNKYTSSSIHSFIAFVKLTKHNEALLQLIFNGFHKWVKMNCSEHWVGRRRWGKEMDMQSVKKEGEWYIHTLWL